MTDNAAETPFTELMARIPRGEALAWYESHGSGAYCHAPVGEYVHRALALIASQAAEIAALKFVVNEYQAELLVLRGQIDCAKEECRRHDLCWSRGRR